MVIRAVILCVLALSAAPAQQIFDRVFPVTRAETMQDLQEAMTLVRIVTDIRQLDLNQSRKAVTVRGTADEVRAVEWLVAALDRPETARQEYQVPGKPDQQFRVFHIASMQSSSDLQELATLIRSLADAQYISTHSSFKVLAIRGSEWRIGLAEWLVNELSQPASAVQPSAPREYRLPGGAEILPPEDVFVRIFYTGARTPEELSSMFAGMRSAVKSLPRSYISTVRGAIVVRSSAGKIAAAEQALQQYRQTAAIP